MENKLQLFKNEELGQVRVIKINEDAWFVGKDLCDILEYENQNRDITRHVDEEDRLMYNSKTRYKNGIEFNHKELGQRGGWLINESGLYSLIFGSKLDNAKKFKKWVTSEVLPSIRKHGAYINDDESTVNQDYIKYTYGQLKETFTNCAIENLQDVYDECLQWHKENKTRIPYANNSKRRKGTKHTATDSKLMIMQKIIATLEARNTILCESGKFGLISEINNVVKLIKDDITTQNNRINGGKLGSKTKKIKEIEDKLNYHIPKLDDYLCLDIHPFSTNYLYSHKNGYTTRSEGYNRWIKNFPNEVVIDKFGDIDLNKPTRMWVKAICKDGFDTDNILKSLQDQIVRCLGANNDNNITIAGVEIIGRVDSYKDGNIYIILRNEE